MLWTFSYHRAQVSVSYARCFFQVNFQISYLAEKFVKAHSQAFCTEHQRQRIFHKNEHRPVIRQYSSPCAKSFIHRYRILLSIMHIQVKCAPEFRNGFWQKKLFLFFKNNFKRNNNFSASFHLKCTGNISESFLM